MKWCVLVFVGLFAAAWGSTLNVKGFQFKQEFKDEFEYEIADAEFLKKYRLILQLFNYINQPSFHKEIIETAKEFSFEKLALYFEEPEDVENFLSLYKRGSLPKGKIFSVFYPEQLKEAKALFRLFYYAKDFETLYKTACWARQNLNEGLFLYSFSVALAQREDCRGFSLPPIYEIYPHYFFSTEVIQKANYLKQKHDSKDVKYEKDFDGYEGYTINANYSGFYLNVNPEQYLSHYTEDIGLNAHNYYHHLYYPFWFKSLLREKKCDTHHRRGEVFYFHVWQMLARYYSARLDSKFGAIQEFDWDVPLKTGYSPSLRYPNGLEFPTRPNFANLKDYFFNYGQRQCPTRKYQYSYTYVKDYFRRLRDVIDKGTVHISMNDGNSKLPVDILDEEGIQVVGNLIEANADSPNLRFFGPVLSYARHLLGYSYQPKDKYNIAPSALEHFETSMRDPAFYQLYKKIFNLFERYKQYLPYYDKKHLYYHGVAVKKVEFDPLKSYYDYYFSDLSNAVYVTPEEAEKYSFRLRAKQYRLNHKPFNYAVHVEAETACKASVRVYIGPKYDEFGRHIDINDNRINFVQLDYFKYDLKAGENVIKRNYKQLFGYCDDSTSYRELYEQVLLAESGKGIYKIKPNYICWPRRYAIPRGSREGTPYQIYVIVSPYKPSKFGRPYKDVYQYPIFRMDDYPLGFPFDRPVYDEDYLNVPNAYFYDTKIYIDESLNKHHTY
ncbi:hypothetical protein WA026_000134 [Henosepilachna vigintioctopunctata]|uniref:Uncharacterized protein n=1 Tax=Henosepilachna vigintioctopunctata TaxID=420089 RepID=A0AAW1V7D9_9CUCU